MTIGLRSRRPEVRILYRAHSDSGAASAVKKPRKLDSVPRVAHSADDSDDWDCGLCCVLNRLCREHELAALRVNVAKLEAKLARIQRPHGVRR